MYSLQYLLNSTTKTVQSYSTVIQYKTKFGYIYVYSSGSNTSKRKVFFLRKSTFILKFRYFDTYHSSLANNASYMYVYSNLLAMPVSGQSYVGCVFDSKKERSIRLSSFYLSLPLRVSFCLFDWRTSTHILIQFNFLTNLPSSNLRTDSDEFALLHSYGLFVRAQYSSAQLALTIICLTSD